MLAKRIVPCLDLKDGRVVKGINFVGLKDAGDPVEVAARYNAEGADEIVFLDITATSEARGIMKDVIARAAEQVFIPLTVGGGIRTLEDFQEMLSVGADKISINSSAFNNPALISQAAERFGSQCVVVAIDAKRRQGSPGFDVYLSGGRVNTGMDAVEWAVKAAQLGAGELLVTSMDCDGVQQGYDNELLKAITSVVNIPVIASGGAGTFEHFKDAINIGGADAVLAASLFHYGLMKINDLKDYLKKEGISVR